MKLLYPDQPRKKTSFFFRLLHLIWLHRWSHGSVVCMHALALSNVANLDFGVFVFFLLPCGQCIMHSIGVLLLKILKCCIYYCCKYLSFFLRGCCKYLKYCCGVELPVRCHGWAAVLVSYGWLSPFPAATPQQPAFCAVASAFQGPRYQCHGQHLAPLPSRPPSPPLPYPRRAEDGKLV